jgi:hypothetical protein
LLAGLTVAVLLIGLAFSFDVSESVVRGTPHWSQAIDAGAKECQATPGLAEVSIPTSPPGFGLYVPCGEAVEAVD